MGISESFLVNADRLNPIIETLIENGKVPAKITEEKLEEIGFDSPSDLLVIHIFKELNLLDQDGTPKKWFEELIDSSTSQYAIAKGVMHGYKDLVTKHPRIHKLKKDEIQEIITDYFGGNKTELIVKYMANTFLKLVSYAGTENFEKARAELIEDTADESAAAAEEALKHQNGTSAAVASDVKAEEKGEQSVEDLLGLTEEESSVSEEAETKEVSASQQQSSTVQEPEKETQEETIDAKNESEPMEKSEPNTMNESPQKTEPKEENPEELFNDSEPTSFETAMEESSSSIPSGEKVQKAFIKKADLLYKMERFEELLPSLNDIINNLDDSDESSVREAVAKSVIRRALILAKLNRQEELMPALDEVINRFENSDKKEYYDHASMAMLSKANLKKNKGQKDQLLPLYNKIINRLKDSSKDQIRGKVDQIFLDRIEVILAQDKKDEQVLDVLDQTIKRFKDSGDKTEYLEEAMFKKAEILEEMNKDEQALQAYNEFIEMFGNKAIA